MGEFNSVLLSLLLLLGEHWGLLDGKDSFTIICASSSTSIPFTAILSTWLVVWEDVPF